MYGYAHLCIYGVCERGPDLLLPGPLCPRQLKLYILKKMRAVKVLIIGWIGDGADGKGNDLAGSWGSLSVKGTEPVLLHWKQKMLLAQGTEDVHWTGLILCSFIRAVYLTTQNRFPQYELHFLLFRSADPPHGVNLLNKVKSLYLFVLFVCLFVGLIVNAIREGMGPRTKVELISLVSQSHTIPIFSIFILDMSEQYM